MRTATMVAAFLRYQYESRRLVQAGIVEATGLTRGMVSLIINGQRVFPMYYVDEVAGFYGMTVPDFLIHAEAELKKAGRWQTLHAADEDEKSRLRMLRLRTRVIDNE
jgi:transcriptional regulator with XRE-family HTH domain